MPKSGRYQTLTSALAHPLASSLVELRTSVPGLHDGSPRDRYEALHAIADANGVKTSMGAAD